jgi:hypothetical protein
MSESKDVIFFTPESKKEVLKVKNNFIFLSLGFKQV